MTSASVGFEAVGIKRGKFGLSDAIEVGNEFGFNIDSNDFFGQRRKPEREESGACADVGNDLFAQVAEEIDDHFRFLPDYAVGVGIVVPDAFILRYARGIGLPGGSRLLGRLSRVFTPFQARD